MIDEEPAVELLAIRTKCGDAGGDVGFYQLPEFRGESLKEKEFLSNYSI